MGKRLSDVCLALGATQSFLPGAVVAVTSFLKQHPGFGGGIVLFHDGLPEALRTTLAEAFPPLRFEPVSRELRERLARLGAAVPPLRERLPRFYSLEAFRIGGYRKVLWCDCDLLFRQPIDDLFEMEDALVCCGDKVFLSGRCRDAATYRPIEEPSGAGPGGAVERTFNTGLLLIDGCLAGEPTYSELLAMVSPETWRGAEMSHTDQFILNRYFAGRQTLVSARYNYQPRLEGAIRAREGLPAGEASVLHFVGVKPWTLEAMLRWTHGDRRFRPHPAFALWYEAWMECLTLAHLRAAARGRGEEREVAG